MIQELCFPGLTELFRDLLQFLDDEAPNPAVAVQGRLQLLDLPLQVTGFCRPLQDILLVDVSQLNLRHKLRLDLIDAEANHQVGDHLCLQLRSPDDGNGLVNVQENSLQALQQVELLPFFPQLEEDPALHALAAPGSPLLQDLSHSHHPGHTGDENIKIAGVGIHQCGLSEQLLHQLLRVRPPLQVDGQLQARQVRLIPHICNFPDFPGSDQF